MCRCEFIRTNMDRTGSWRANEFAPTLRKSVITALDAVISQPLCIPAGDHPVKLGDDVIRVYPVKPDDCIGLLFGFGRSHEH